MLHDSWRFKCSTIQMLHESSGEARLRAIFSVSLEHVW